MKAQSRFGEEAAAAGSTAECGGSVLYDPAVMESPQLPTWFHPPTTQGCFNFIYGEFLDK